MNKIILAVCFVILILCGFMFGYVLTQTHLYFQSMALMIAYYLSLVYVIVQFIENPKDVKK